MEKSRLISPLHTLTLLYPPIPSPSHTSSHTLTLPYAGVALVTADKALLWTDGRYHLQASKQLDANWTLMKQGEVWGHREIGNWD